MVATDIGRSIRDIAQKFVDPTLLSDVVAVLHQPITPKTEVQSQDGQWYVRQVLPYRTHDNRTEGVVITFSDVAAEALQKARLYAESIVDTVRDGDPFILDNARRLEAIAWSVLALEVLRMIVAAIAAVVWEAGRVEGFSIASWFAVLLLFVLAGVFAHGTRMRADLEGTV
jgi:hypothetical protein